MIKTFLLIILILILFPIGCIGILLFAHDLNTCFQKINPCLHKVSKWSYSKNVCSLNNDQKNEIENIIETVFTAPDPFRNNDLDNNVFSKDLNELIIKAKALEEFNIQQIAKSDYPMDKPDIIEGDIFVSLYEGFTSYSVKNISIMNDSAYAMVEFSNKDYEETWIDKIILVNEGKWKIDNVIYQKVSSTYGYTNTKKVLLSFLKAQNK